jgi:hypothetical protein
MKNSQKIQELEAKVNNANTANAEGRQLVANACKELYNLIEEDLYNAGAQWMLKGLYNDLCNGNFSQPFLCEQKKNDFLIAKKVYQDRVSC